MIRERETRVRETMMVRDTIRARETIIRARETMRVILMTRDIEMMRVRERRVRERRVSYMSMMA